MTPTKLSELPEAFSQWPHVDSRIARSELSDLLSAFAGIVQKEIDGLKVEVRGTTKPLLPFAKERLGHDPKGDAGKQKPQLQLIPPVFNIAVAGALALGAEKYGVANWRNNNVQAMTYIGAMRRHIDAYLDGQDIDPESGVSHLAHVAACCAITLDAAASGTLVDNRPPCNKIAPVHNHVQHIAELS